MKEENFVMDQEKTLFDKVEMTKSLTFQKKFYVYMKRTFDVLISLIGMLFLIPICFIVKILYLCCGDYNSIF